MKLLTKKKDQILGIIVNVDNEEEGKVKKRGVLNVQSDENGDEEIDRLGKHEMVLQKSGVMNEQSY